MSNCINLIYSLEPRLKRI